MDATVATGQRLLQLRGLRTHIEVPGGVLRLLDGVERCLLRIVEGLQPLLANMEIPSLCHALHAGGRKDPDVVDQTSQRLLVLGEPVTVRVQAHRCLA